MIKEFFLKQMLKRQGVPEGQIDMVMTLVNKNPELFKQIAEEIKGKMSAGKDQQAAAMEVMLAHQAEIQKLMQS
ncbi:MAG: hypothetical protein NTY66_03390 [Candidatus Vogelbacteria bacterium]|nr:hypothetical protein [Candidatus Vogelbacteria bacterium]